jgi:hypothetical protein
MSYLLALDTIQLDQQLDQNGIHDHELLSIIYFLKVVEIELVEMKKG